MEDRIKVNILVTGGAGFIGQHLVRHLNELGHFTIVCDIMDKQAHKGLVAYYPGNKLYVSDVRNRNSLRYMIQENNIEIIFHLAAFTGAGQSMYDISEYTDHNVLGTSVLMDVIANTPNKVRKIILASSRAVYGEGPYFCAHGGKVVYPDPRKLEALRRGEWHVNCPYCRHAPLAVNPMGEYSTLKPTSIYGATKLAQENLVRITAESYEREYINFRLFNVYGPGQSINNPYTGIISIFMNRALNNKPIHVYEDGNMIRDFIYIEDVTDALIKGMDISTCDTFNLGSGEPLNLIGAAREIQKSVGVDQNISIIGQFRMGDARHSYADMVKTRSCLGILQEPTKFSDGIVKLRDWAKEQPLYNLPEDEMLKKKGLSK